MISKIKIHMIEGKNIILDNEINKTIVITRYKVCWFFRQNWLTIIVY